MELTKTNAPSRQANGANERTQLDSDSCDRKGKAFTTLRAKLALLGYSASELSDGSFLVTRWDRSRHLADLHGVAAFLRQVGGANA